MQIVKPAPDQNLPTLAWYLLTSDGSLSVRVLPGLTVGVDGAGGLVFNGLDDERLVEFGFDQKGLQFEVIGNSHKVCLNQLPVAGKLPITLNSRLLVATNELKFDCRMLDTGLPVTNFDDTFKIVLPEFGEISAAELEETETVDEDLLETEEIVLTAVPEAAAIPAPIPTPARRATYKRKPTSRLKMYVAGLIVLVSSVLAWIYNDQDKDNRVQQTVTAELTPVLTAEPPAPNPRTPEQPTGQVAETVTDEVEMSVVPDATGSTNSKDAEKITLWLEEGDLLFTQGFWTRGRDTASARYLQVLAVDPTNQRAIVGMDLVYAGIRRMSDPVTKSRSLEALKKLLADVPRLSVLHTQITLLNEPAKTIASDLEVAQNLFQAGFINAPSGNNAVAKLKKILHSEANNVAALMLLEQCADRLVATAEEASAAGFDYEARNLIEEVLAFLPQHSEANELWQQWSGGREN